MTYLEKLQHPKWQEKRLRVMERDKFSCRKCGSHTKHLNVHHRFYLKGREPWEYDDSTLETLCRECHEEVTKAQDFLKEFFGTVESSDLVNFVNRIRHCADAMRYPLPSLFWYLQDSLIRPENEKWEPPQDIALSPDEEPF